MPMFKLSDINMPKIKRETKDDDNFISYFVSVQDIPRGHNFRLSINGQTFFVTLPVAVKHKDSDDILPNKMLNNSLILKNVIAKRQIRGTSFYQKREIREYVIDLQGNIFEIRAGLNNEKEVDPDIYTSGENKITANRDNVIKTQAINKLTIEELEKIIEIKKGVNNNNSEKEYNNKNKTITKKNPSEWMKKYWQERKSQDKNKKTE